MEEDEVEYVTIRGRTRGEFDLVVDVILIVDGEEIDSIWEADTYEEAEHWATSRGCIIVREPDPEPESPKFMWEAPITIYHVEWNEGIIVGKFFSELNVAKAFAEVQTVVTKKPTILTPVVVPSFDPSRIVIILNGEENAIEWKEDKAVMVFPKLEYKQVSRFGGGLSIRCDQKDGKDILIAANKQNSQEFANYAAAYKWLFG